MNDKTYTVEGAKAIKETDKALLVRADEFGECWVPKSQIHDDSEVYEQGHEGKLVVTLWFAEKENWG